MYDVRVILLLVYDESKKRQFLPNLFVIPTRLILEYLKKWSANLQLSTSVILQTRQCDDAYQEYNTESIAALQSTGSRLDSVHICGHFPDFQRESTLHMVCGGG